MKLVISCPAHNNIKYTKLFLGSIKCSYQYELFIIDNGSTDETPSFLKSSNINHIRYNENRGFSYAYNDAIDYTFKDTDNLLLFCGNDTMFRPNSIDFLVRGMLETDYEMLCGSEVLTRDILKENVEALENFKYDFSFDDKVYTELIINPKGMNHSCLIRRKSVIDKVGYYDIGFYPAYFEDNDYSKRCDLLDIKYGTVLSATFYHFWSRTIHEGGLRELNDVRFGINRNYYELKWGGLVGKETYNKPFGCGDIKISNRSSEDPYLRKLGVLS
jgi:GT2 family glycosyltransferase